MEVGQLCIKLAGRDAGKECLIIEEAKNNYVLIDGNTRRRKCNICHLELLPNKADIKKGASTEEVKVALKKLGIAVEKKERTRPKKVETKKVEKKEEPKEEKPKKEAKKKAAPKKAKKA